MRILRLVPNDIKWDKFKYAILLWLIFVLIIVLHKNPIGLFGWDDSAPATMDFYYNYTKPMALKLESECCGENMVYSITLNDSRIINGKKFDCSSAWLLERYRLSDKYAIKENITVKRPGDPKFVFVAAANSQFFPSLRALMVHVKQTFGCKQRIIVYDLGGITKNKQMMSELSSVCELEWRIFEFAEMNSNVRDLKSFAWKIFIFASEFKKILMEYETFVWLDTSIVFDSKNLDKFLDPMQKGIIGHMQRPSFTGHGVNFATHSKTFEFLPMYTNFEQPRMFEVTGHDPPMFEANFVIIHKSEQTRQMMKWAILCANERECIAPIESTINCIGKNRTKAGECHRQDQSVISIVATNMEYQQNIENPSFLTHFDLDHPRNKDNPIRYTVKESEAGMAGLFRMGRRQHFDGSDAEFAKKVACC